VISWVSSSRFHAETVSVSLVEVRVFNFYHEEELPIMSVGPCREIVEYVSPDKE
jgi:hypothetical protein